MESVGKNILQPAEVPASCEVCYIFTALGAITHVGLGFGDAAVSKSFLLL